MNYIEDSVFFEIRHRAVSELRWKQVKILHGPATVMKELCSVCHCTSARYQHDIERTEDGCGKVSNALIAKSGDMHK